VSEVRSKIAAALQVVLEQLNKLSVSQEKLKKEVQAKMNSKGHKCWPRQSGGLPRRTGK
jgi:hypothetical protein